MEQWTEVCLVLVLFVSPHVIADIQDGCPSNFLSVLPCGEVLFMTLSGCWLIYLGGNENACKCDYFPSPHWIPRRLYLDFPQLYKKNRSAPTSPRSVFLTSLSLSAAAMPHLVTESTFCSRLLRRDLQKWFPSLSRASRRALSSSPIAHRT